MLNVDVRNDEKRLVINGHNFDAIGVAVDRTNLAEVRRLCSTLNLPVPWRAALREWARSGCEFLVMYGDAAGYNEGEPAVMVADDAHAFERSIHTALIGTQGREFYWASCLEQSHEDQLMLALYVDTHLCGTA
jgi:hypothetical protein